MWDRGKVMIMYNIFFWGFESTAFMVLFVFLLLFTGH